jgi:hypothetical protein
MRPLLILHFLCLPAFLQAQEKVDVRSYVERIRNGGGDQVREEVNGLLNRFPGDPGVQYLHGLVTVEGADAVRVFQGIVDSHPRSEWADDALYRVYQFYHALGLYRTADLKMAQLREEYPESEYLAGSDAGPSAGSAADTTRDNAPPPVVPPAGMEGRTDQQGQFALQVGAYSSQENAEKQKLFFEDQGYPVDVINRVRDSRSLFLVLVGNYLTYDEAKGKGAEIRRLYSIDSFVVSR